MSEREINPRRDFSPVQTYPPAASGAGTGTVTSVDVAMSGLASSGAVTTSGTITLTVDVADTFRHSFGLGTADSPQFTAVNVGHASDTTVTRSAAGKLAVEGKAVPLMSGAFDLVIAGPTAARTWTGPDSDQTLLYSGGALGTPSSGTLSSCSGYTASVNLAENKELKLVGLTLSADGKYTGIDIAGTAGTTLAFGDLVYLAVADSRWELADADAASTAGDVLLGICVLAAAADGDATTILLSGTVRADAAFPALTIGAPVYVSTTAGDIQVAQPSGTDDVIRVVGYALTADSIMFCPASSYITHT